ncbi:FUSC family membrane protein [Aureibaculum sp. 2210JD6-5]|uniref:FUSC family protein n=1 Tax=Aureibaculum sp. 2210JD6-5 TaxID=3103957 RepID=UPI002AADC8E5|nr:FUSC family membrane protein [Aureibaculum sp. 2210JD6-5]MDY7393662.1 FUSC family membrane protein [Aureibaculum sp. 2210JD6-5]
MLRETLKNIELFLRGASFYRGVILTIAIAIPIGILFAIDQTAIILPIVFGAFVNAPSDIAGSLKRKVNGILISIALTVAITGIILVAKPYLLILLMALAILSFFSAMIAIYGFRGSLIAFSGLLAMVLALAVKDVHGLDILIHLGFMVIGGLWYLLISLLLYRMASKKDEKQLLSETLALTGEYLKLRGELLVERASHDNLFKRILELQTEISDKHETLRESLLTTRRKSGRSRYEEKRLLIFISLVDILELALANTIDYTKINSLFKADKNDLEAFKNVNVVMGEHLMLLSEIIINNDKIPKRNELLHVFEKADKAIENYVKQVGLPKAREGALTLRNLYTYQLQLLDQIRAIRRAMSNVENASKLSLKTQDGSQFITLQEYRFSILLEHLSPKSTIFRHAIRLSTTVVVAYLIGTFLDIKNAYWILLTLIVIMRPNYGLTKERSQNRIIGTIIGAALASLVIFTTQNVVVYGVLGLLSLTFAFSLIQQNYKVGAAFITLHVIFVYALLQPNAYEVIGYRVLDTAIGAILAVIANYLLWPLWEFKNLDQDILEVLKQNDNYLLAIQKQYNSKNVLQPQYKLHRKEAFLAMSELNAAFQRVSQDPKSKQKEFQLIYDIVTLNHTIVSAIASLSSFIQKHKTSSIKDQFDVFVAHISNTLKETANILNQNKKLELSNSQNIENAQEELLDNYVKLANERDQEIQLGQLDIKQEKLVDLQEAHLLYNQLVWLKNLTDNLKKATHKYKKALA